MERIEYRDNIDKTKWPLGPWMNEPDKIQWQDEATGLPCLIVRNRLGALCGYVGVPDLHIFHGRGYSECTNDPKCGESYCSHSPECILNVHGGITFASGCKKLDREAWIGFLKIMASRREEAEKYPLGDAAEDLKIWGDVSKDYNSWLTKMESGSICHKATPGEPDNIWWFGFDCNHAGDLAPGMQHFLSSGYRSLHRGDVYRDIAYVEAECASLAKQLAEYRVRVPGRFSGLDIPSSA